MILENVYRRSSLWELQFTEIEPPNIVTVPCDSKILRIESGSTKNRVESCRGILGCRGLLYFIFELNKTLLSTTNMTNHFETFQNNNLYAIRLKFFHRMLRCEPLQMTICPKTLQLKSVRVLKFSRLESLRALHFLI